MKVKDYESGQMLTARNTEVKDADPCTLVLMSNADSSLVSRVTDGTTTERDDEIIDKLSQMLLMASSQDGNQSWVGFVDVDSPDRLRKMATFPAYHSDIRDYEFPDPSTAPAYEDIVSG